VLRPGKEVPPPPPVTPLDASYAFFVLSRYWYRAFIQTYSATSPFNPHREMDKTFSPSYSSSQITYVEGEAVEFSRFRFHRKRTASTVSTSRFRFHIPGATAPPKFWISENPLKHRQNVRKFRQNMCKPSQHCCMCVYFTKMAPKMKVKTFFWGGGSCLNLVVFGQVRINYTLCRKR